MEYSDILKTTVSKSFQNAGLKFVKYIPLGIYNFFTAGHPRTVMLKKNALGAFFLKGLDYFIGFVRIPIIISFLSVTEYGIWLTLSSVIGWFLFFDIGLSNGLKTKLAEALAVKDFNLAKIYISTTYVAISMIAGVIFVLFVVLFPFLNWAQLLNVPEEIKGQIAPFVFIFVSLFTAQFIMNIISTVLTADQKPALASSIGTISSVVYLLFLIILKLLTKGSLIHLTIICNGTTVVVFTLASIYFYKKKYAEIAPDIKSVDFKHFGELATLGLKFFFIQISAIIMFSTDNMIITQLYTPADVTPYGISMKYMGIPLTLFSMITWPLWAAFSDAFTTKDYTWIKGTVRKLVTIWSFMILLILFFLLISSELYKLWLGDELHVPFMLTCFMGLYSILIGWNQIFVYFLNGTGKIKLQLYMGFITIVLNIPLSIYFAKGLNLGPAGVILATIACIFIGSVWAPIQYHKIINNKARGVWNQ